MNTKAILLAAVAATTFATAVFALTNRVSIDKAASEICINSKGIPDHSFGQLPTEATRTASNAKTSDSA